MFKRTLVTFDQAHRAIKHGNLASIRQALDAGMDANLSNKFSWTLLMLAGIEGNTGVGELLIKRGADPNKVNDGGETALSLAARAGHVRFVELLLDNRPLPRIHKRCKSVRAILRYRGQRGRA